MRLFFQSIECKGNCDFHCRHSLSHCFSRRRPIQRLAGGANQIIKTPNGALKPEVCTDAYTSPAGNRLSQVKMGSAAQGGVVTKRDCRSPAGNNASRRPLRRRGVYCAAVRGMKLCTILDIISSMNFLIGGVMSNTKKCRWVMLSHLVRTLPAQWRHQRRLKQVNLQPELKLL